MLESSTVSEVGGGVRSALPQSPERLVAAALAHAEAAAGETVPDHRASDLAQSIRTLHERLLVLESSELADVRGEPSAEAVAVGDRLQRAIADAEDQCGRAFYDARHALSALEGRTSPSPAAHRARTALVDALLRAGVDPGSDPLASARAWLATTAPGTRDRAS